jgi:hypothetical protein
MIASLRIVALPVGVESCEQTSEKKSGSSDRSVETCG